MQHDVLRKSLFYSSVLVGGIALGVGGYNAVQAVGEHVAVTVYENFSKSTDDLEASRDGYIARSAGSLAVGGTASAYVIASVRNSRQREEDTD